LLNLDRSVKIMAHLLKPADLLLDGFLRAIFKKVIVLVKAESCSVSWVESEVDLEEFFEQILESVPHLHSHSTRPGSKDES